MSRFLQTLAALLILQCAASVTRAGEVACAHSGSRFALVIGNSHYGGNDDVSGIEDARQMADALCALQFNVIVLTDGKRDQILTELNNLQTRIQQASVVFFFFSGHGFQNGAENYLMPVDGSVFPKSSLPLATLKTTLAWAPNEAVKLVFLDACRAVKQLPDDEQGLRAEQAPSSQRTLYAFAAGPGLKTPAGKPTEVSAYSKVLLHYLKEPGLKLSELLDRISSDSAVAGQLPSYVINDVPSDFYLRDPVFVRADIAKVDGELLVLVNGEVVLNSNQPPSSGHSPKLPLKAGHNDLLLFMSKGKSYHNGQSWEITEGWSYELKIGLDPARVVSCSGPGQNGFCFSANEDHPFKDGPHHGGAFAVARATIVVDGSSDPPKVTLEKSDTDIWRREAPVWARDQEPLFNQSVTSLGLTADDILGGLPLPMPWPVLLRPVAQELLTSGNLLGFKVAEPSQTFVMVWGNKLLRDAVQSCMTDERAARLRDLRASIAAVFARKDKPFSGYDQGLTDCVRRKGAAISLDSNDIPIWTAIHDQSKEHGPTG